MKTKEELNKMKKKELIEYCKNNNITKYSNKDKLIIIDLILEKQLLDENITIIVDDEKKSYYDDEKKSYNNIINNDDEKMFNDNNSTNLSLDYINNRIKNEYNVDIFNKLKDNSLMYKYKQTVSFKQKYLMYEQTLKKYILDIDDEIIENIINELNIVSHGTKSVIRGKEFNNIVRDYIIELYSNNQNYNIAFEKNNSIINTSEIPDWYIECKRTKKVIIGMNQLDLWGGGQQINRGYKYIIDDKPYKIVCVVCNFIKIKTIKSKEYNLFNIGFKKERICYLNNLSNIINNYFELID